VLVASGAGLVLLALVAAVVVLAGGDDGAEVTSGPGTTTGGPTSTARPPTTATAPATTTGLPPTTAPTTTAAPALRTFTIAATGDFLIHTRVSDRALANGGGTTYDFDPMLAEVTPLLAAADLAVCHLEVPLSADDADISGYPVFSAPRELAADVADAGYDTCSTVSNHALDRGFAGVRATLDALDAAGVHHAGSARSPLEAAAPTMFDVAGVRIAHLAYTYGLNGFPVPAEAPWSIALLDPARVLQDAAAARGAGAEFVLVSLQWGAEYQQTPTADQVAVAQTLLGSPDIDLLIGHHVHVVQPVGMVGDEVAAYGLGNFLSNQSPEAGLLPSTQDGVILHLTVTEVAPGDFTVSASSFTPTFVDREGGYVIRPVDEMSNPDSYQRTVSAMTALGMPGLVPDR
jgi:poly-gamma-glutamate synthesis protein (capsule biosynthesis protein)